MFANFLAPCSRQALKLFKGDLYIKQYFRMREPKSTVFKGKRLDREAPQNKILGGAIYKFSELMNFYSAILA